MKVSLTAAPASSGRHVIPTLSRRGHQVVATTTSAAKRLDSSYPEVARNVGKGENHTFELDRDLEVYVFTFG